MAHVEGPGDVRRGNGDRIVLGGRALSGRMKPAALHPVFEDTLLDGTGLPAGGLLEGLASLRVHAADYSHSRPQTGRTLLDGCCVATARQDGPSLSGRVGLGLERLEHPEDLADPADEQALLIYLHPDTCRGREDDVVAGLHRHFDACGLPPVEPGPYREHDPLLGWRLIGPRRDH